jgi:hypothetical protein
MLLLYQTELLPIVSGKVGFEPTTEGSNVVPFAFAFCLVPSAGFEPAAFRFVAECSSSTELRGQC